MRVIFVGVGEACDERYPNTSILVKIFGSEGKKRCFLLDCGFSAAHAFWNYVTNPEKLDAIWISHFHGDHFMGVPLLLLRMWEMGRKRPLTIIGQKGIVDVVEKAMELSYPGFMNRFRFELTFIECEPGISREILGCTWSFAETEHSKRNLAVAIETSSEKLFYSGDGRPSSDSVELISGSTIIIHEAFHVRDEVPGHGTVKNVVEIARNRNIKHLALVHMQRDVRKWRELQIRRELAKLEDINVYLPLPGECLEL